jgi:hypothetical protein
MTHDDRAIRVITDHGWQQVMALDIRQGFCHTATDRSHQRIGRTQVDTGRQSMLVRGSGFTGF